MLVTALGLDGPDRLLDVGCGPGSLTLLLAPHFARAIGIDADGDMITEAARLVEERHAQNVRWRHLRAEDLPADLPAARVVTFASRSTGWTAPASPPPSAGSWSRAGLWFRAAGFTGPHRLQVPGRIVDRTVEQVVASVHSLSSSAPHLFGDRLERFDADVRALLSAASADGRFSEQMRPIALDIWR